MIRIVYLTISIAILSGSLKAQDQKDITKMTKEDVLALSSDELKEIPLKEALQMADIVGVSVEELSEMLQNNIVISTHLIMDPEIVQEEAVIFTDRSLYATNEQLFFSVKYNVSPKLTNKDWSTVLYLELISPDGKALIQKKYPLQKSGFHGSIQIPEKLLTGVYYLKAYTKWMRNFPVTKYAYCQVKILNPNSARLQQYTSSNPKHLLLESTTDMAFDIALSTEKEQYGSREKVSVSFKELINNYNAESYCVSVVRKGAKTEMPVSLQNDSIPSEQTTVFFYPEISGLSLSGVLLDGNNSAVKDVGISLSLLNKKTYYSRFNTTERGHFFFSFPPSTGEHDFYIKAHKNDQTLNIELDKEFCSKSLQINQQPFELNDEEKALAQEICFNAQIFRTFKDTSMQTGSIIPEIEDQFYGSPEKVIYTKDFVDLPNVEEFINELVPGIFVKNKKDVTTIQSGYNHSLINFPFLILMDNIPISDLSILSKIRTSTIERFEFISEGYVIGDAKYSGIINLFTKSKNMSGIDLSENSMFFNYQTYSSDQQYTSLLVNLSSTLTDLRSPDLRNCLYWNPDFKLSGTTEKSFSFYTSDVTGNYQVIIQGVSNDGSQTILAKTEFVVE